MNEQDIIKSLKIEQPVDAPAHRTALRSALLSMHSKRRARFALLQNFLNFIQMKRYSIPVGVFAVVALAFAINFSAIDPNIAQAQEQVQRAFTRAIQISPEMRVQIEAKMKADMIKTLEEAKAAPDLKTMTKEEYEKTGGFTISTQPFNGKLKATKIINAQFGGDVAVNAKPISISANSDAMFTVATATAISAVKGVAMAGTVTAGSFSVAGGGEMKMPVKYLSYTDPRGNKTVLGLDENDTPVFKMTELQAKDMIHLKDAAISSPGIPAGEAGFHTMQLEAVEVGE